MNTNAITVIYSDGHPMARALETMDHTYLYEDNFDFTRLRKNSFIIDLTILNDSDKEAWLQEVTARYPVISDTSCNWGEYLQTRFDKNKLIAQMAAAFYSPKAKVEVHLHDDHKDLAPLIESFLAQFSLSPFYVSEVGHGFTYPRTLCTLVNEAYFALEDGLATKEDMDQAMNFGVNYPHGLFDWAQKVGLNPILMLLQSLYQQTGDPRYRQAPLLKLESVE
jgi:3-hydroxybutyryl-CoA dehydrogenase